MKFRDKLRSFLYLLLSSNAPNRYNKCSQCKNKRNWYLISAFDEKTNYLVGYYKITGEWVIFEDYNLYVKVLVLNGYIDHIFKLNKNIWNDLHFLCKKCIMQYDTKHNHRK
jgi:hypothetical protein